jgi:hypothetical protein
VAELSTATAFWSYAHADDDGTRSRIRKLSIRVGHAYRMHSGDSLKRFFDRDGVDGIKWSEEWRRKIRETIFGTTFFIPVVSPCYLRSPICRDEFNQFWERAERSNLKELLLPIIWVPVMRPATNEEQRIWDIVQEIQYLDWTKTRLQDRSSPKYERRIDTMGARLAEISRRMADRPELLPEAPEAGAPAESPPSLKDVGAALGQLLREVPQLLAIYVKLAPLQKTLDEQREATQAALQQVMEVTQTEPPPVGASAGQQLMYINAIALKIGAPANDFERAASDLETTARSLNELVFELVDWFRTSTLGQRQKFNITALRQLPDKWLEQFGRYDQARQSISRISDLSRSFQQPMATILRGFDSLDAVKEMTEDWAIALEPFAKDLTAAQPDQEQETNKKPDG